MPKPNRPTIDESVTAYLRTLSGADKSASTITAYRPDLSQLARFLREPNRAVSSLADGSQTDVVVYRIHLAGQGTSGTTRDRTLAALREFSRLRETEDSVAANLTREGAIPKKETRRPRSMALAPR